MSCNKHECCCNEDHKCVMEAIHNLKEKIEAHCCDCRERSLAKTKLQELCFWVCECFEEEEHSH